MICSTHSDLTAVHSQYFHQLGCLGSVGTGTGTSRMFCFVSFATAAFHSQDLTSSQLLLQSRLQDFQSSFCVEPHRNICKAHAYHFKMFFLAQHVTVVSMVK